MALDEKITEKLDRLRSLIRNMGHVVVAYSGGVDSALVTAVAHQELGSDALACIGVSPSYPERECQTAVALAEELGVRYQIVPTEEHLDPRYAANPVDRCYYCKSDLYLRLQPIAESEGGAVIIDGTNASDDSDFRPGRIAGKENGVQSPLFQAGITKEEIRLIAREMGLSVWDKPAMACLSSRVPQGMLIVPELLKKIEQAEDVLVSLGFRQFRVRHHGEIARIEVPAEDFERVVAMRDAINNSLKEIGYRFVVIDLSPFYSGSLSRANHKI